MSSPSPPLTPPTSDSENEPDKSLGDYETYPCAPLIQLRSRTLPLSTSSPHPFAASTKANRAPPLYEKKSITPPITPPEPPRKITSTETRELQRHDSRVLCHSSPPLDESEQNLWDEAISSAVDGAKAKLDLSGNNLTYIPPHIIDLKNLVVLSKFVQGVQVAGPGNSRSFKRSVTAPAHLASTQVPRTRPFIPTCTTHNLRFTAMQRKSIESRSKCEIELYLMRNAIRVLPRELFGLDCLVVLSLRQNKLTSLPPAIGQLTRLRELNVASNRLTYLPAEILNLRLTSLNLHPNPFITAPAGLFDRTRIRYCGQLERKSSVPSLSEVMLRFLLAPAYSKQKFPTRLEASMMQHPLDSLPLPDHFKRIVHASTRHTLASKKGTPAEDDMTANICPNPDHLSPRVIRGVEISDRTFYNPVETMMEWVGVVAGVQVAESPQAWVPVMWRGCSKGCLAFLESEEEIVEEHDVPTFVAGTGEDGEIFEFSDEELS